ncbi:MAG: hypothetical protein ACRDLF_03255 [Solirubrobacteraceae bacterium]
MAGEALFLGWGPVVRGREQKSLQVFQETIAYYGKLQQEGKIDSFEPVLVAPHGGDLGGFVLLRGERGKLDAIRSSEEFERSVVRAASVVDNVGVINAVTGESLGQGLARFQAASEELA